ncbi:MULTISPECIES: S66 family peptidase [Bacillus cereus group]|uniref:Peptidase U61 LD-carboxypeptidase A n=1 Tax=Bacillus cytotoxicus (strain DSM 22905 / CIP 110041 / 391-98 / NVH 391-98) TaxID=315749 RepID=A7GVA8_BACCN|nr:MULTISPECIES: S66 peptidase family protein [Bacillus cereus group]ABS24066.1 peptidase U61 LD-carboxypeptidase A [Bacillus cytotoxicus NVH 391-98]AWC34696.1 LD-carboxypeptidase [Bacillus cytotoxicus]AWC38688.1 LD-carboxypeptidase [Bacillus cytotoxicus]AWC46665.1 LD-carboxypeptidase [Bacillus cytotoxicus]AWC62907.1 LD-carboxypeptidase [Bacillus cytotoxicus]
MFPQKLKQGDEIRVISPSCSLSIVSHYNRNLAIERLTDMGFQVTFSKHAEEIDRFASSSISSRVQDLHEAFSDPNVKAILTTLGGYNSNGLLKYLDYDYIRQNPKILCGYSDITALSNAIYKKTGLVTYSGPHFSSFGMKHGLDYTIDYFLKCLTTNDAIEIVPSKTWSDDLWYIDQEQREFMSNEGYISIHEGESTGEIVGGNMSTFNLLQGTPYMPSLCDKILFLEEDDLTGKSTIQTFNRYLHSLIQQPGFEHIKGIVLGRMQKGAASTMEDIQEMIDSKPELTHIPVIANANFGHTTPIFTFPIGGRVKMISHKTSSSITILTH